MGLWLKSNFGLFFDFTSSGPLNWLAIPLSIYILITVRKREPWEQALTFIFIFAFILFWVDGRGTPRYYFTLFPLTQAAIFIYGWTFLKNKQAWLRISIITLCILAVILNFYRNFDAYKYQWNYKIRVSNITFPDEILDFINNSDHLNKNSRFLVLHHTELFFYHTDKLGIPHNSPWLDELYIQPNFEASLKFIKNQLKIEYIFLNGEFNRLYTIKPIIKQIITHNSEMMFQDNKNGYLLYKIRDADPKKENLDRIFMNDSLLKNGSLENWSRGPDKKPDFFEGGDNVFEGMAIREEKEVIVGKYSAKITGDNFNFTQILTDIHALKGKILTCFVWVKTDEPDKYRIKIDAGVETGFSRRHSGNGEWELLQANLKIDPQAESIVIRIISARKTGIANDVVYVDGALMVEGNWNTFYLYRKHLESEKLSPRNYYLTLLPLKNRIMLLI